MTIPGFILRNALRNKRRLVLTVFSVALSLFLFTTLQTALRELTQPAATEDAALRIVVRHKVSLANVLPAKYQARLDRLPGVQLADQPGREVGADVRRVAVEHCCPRDSRARQPRQHLQRRLAHAFIAGQADRLPATVRGVERK